jgi:hypothetical protein
MLMIVRTDRATSHETIVSAVYPGAPHHVIGERSGRCPKEPGIMELMGHDILVREKLVVRGPLGPELGKVLTVMGQF